MLPYVCILNGTYLFSFHTHFLFEKVELQNISMLIKYNIGIDLMEISEIKKNQFGRFIRKPVKYIGGTKNYHWYSPYM